MLRCIVDEASGSGKAVEKRVSDGDSPALEESQETLSSS